MSQQTILSTVVFLLLCIATFLLLDFGKGVLLSVERRANQKKKQKAFRPPGKLKRMIHRLKQKARRVITASPIPNGFFLPITATCAAGGFVVGKMIFSSTFLSVFVGVLATTIPLIVLSLREQQNQNRYLHRLASSMQVLSNAYLMTEDFITSVRDNLSILDEPKPFRLFLLDATMMDSDVVSALRRMGNGVGNPYFVQWVDALCLAQSDRSLRFVCLSVVDALHDVLQAQEESDAAMFAVWSEYLITLLMIFCIPLVFKVLLPDAYLTMTHSLVGQSLMALLLVAVVFSVFRAIRVNRPMLS